MDYKRSNHAFIFSLLLTSITLLRMRTKIPYAPFWPIQKTSFTEEQRAEMIESAFRVLDDDRFAPVFGSGSRPEVALTGSVGTIAVSGRMDRLVVTPDRVLVIDYKTNRPAPARIEDADPAYVLQLAVYAAILRDLTEFATQERFVYSHPWNVGDLVVWDNRTTMHRARRYDDLHEVRDMIHVWPLLPIAQARPAIQSMSDLIRTPA